MPTIAIVGRRASRRLPRVVCIGAVLAGLCGCGESTVAGDSPTPQRFAVLSTFPGEMAPLLAQMTVDHTEMVNGRMFRIGTLAGVPVVLGMTGIGLVNAATTTGALLDRFAVAGVLLSAVAGGTTQQIGDVAVPEAFALKDGTTYAVSAAWRARVGALAAAGLPMLEQCTVIADPPPADPVCMPRPAAIVTGGVGLSSDPYGGKAFACSVGGSDLYGCDLPSPPPPDPAGTAHPALLAAAGDVTPVTQDMETAAIAQAVLAHGLPFIAFRAISDGGTGDPLGRSGFVQFAAYFRFAARNAAAATLALLQQVATAP